MKRIRINDHIICHTRDSIISNDTHFFAKSSKCRYILRPHISCYFHIESFSRRKVAIEFPRRGEIEKPIFRSERRIDHYLLFLWSRSLRYLLRCTILFITCISDIFSKMFFYVFNFIFSTLVRVFENVSYSRVEIRCLRSKFDHVQF